MAKYYHKNNPELILGRLIGTTWTYQLMTTGCIFMLEGKSHKEWLRNRNTTLNSHLNQNFKLSQASKMDTFLISKCDL